MLQSADPGDGALNANAEAGVRNAAVTPEIEIPLKGLARKPVLFDSLLEESEFVNSLRTPNDLAIPFGRQTIVIQCQVRPLGVGLHIEGLDLRRIMMDKNRPVVVEPREAAFSRLLEDRRIPLECF